MILEGIIMAILIILTFLSILLPLHFAEGRRTKGIKKYLDNNKCLKCGKRKQAEYSIIDTNSFNVYCNNEKCDNFGRKILIKVEDVLNCKNSTTKEIETIYTE